jgi:hypothetical protein
MMYISKFIIKIRSTLTCFSLGGSAGKARYNYVNTWGDIIPGNYYIPRLVVSVFFLLLVFFFVAVRRPL